MKSIKNHEKTLLFWKFSIFFLHITLQKFKNPAESPPKNDFGSIFSIFIKNSKSMFSLHKSCRNSEKIIFERFFQFSAKFSKFIFSLQKPCRKSEKTIFGRFFHFSAKFVKSIFPLRNPAENPKKNYFLGIFFTFQKKF